MSDPNWTRAKELLAQALELDGVARSEFVEKLLRQDATIGREVETLLNAHESAEGAGFLDGPPMAPPPPPPRAEQPPAPSANELTLPDTRASASDRGPGRGSAPTLPFDPVTDATLDGPPSDASPPDHRAGVGRQGDTLQADQVAPAPSGTTGVGAEPSSSGAQFITDDYEVLDELGVGGMGVVYKAYQHSLRRFVALKIIPTRLLRSSEQVARFYLEAEAAAGLDHPGIVPVQDVGEHQGVHYYAMALVEGGSLASFAGKRDDNGELELLPPRRAAEVMEQVCRAVQYAHDHAVIHRDIKPANILLDKEGRPRLTDFGLAKVTDEDDGLTVTGQVMGTPSYMAPEQAEGRSHAISNRTDVYSLGATLYALLSGRPPFRAENVLTTLKKVKESAPEPLDRTLPIDLRTICDKCLAKLPEQRYESAAALADDLRRYLGGYSISARRVAAWQRGVRWCQRNPLIAALLSAVAVTLIGATVVSAVFALEANRQADAADAALAQARQNAQRLGRAIEETFIFASEGLLAEEPGMATARQTLLENAQRYYQELIAAEQGAESKLAGAAFMLGRVQASLGGNEAASRSFQQALALQRPLVEQAPGAVEPLLAIAATHNEYARLGRSIWKTRQIDRPEQGNRRGLSLWREHAKACVEWREQAARLAPDGDPEPRRLHANALMNLALSEVEYALAEPDGADVGSIGPLLAESQAIRRALIEADPGGSDTRRDFALGLAATADLRALEADRATRPRVAEKLSRQSLALRTKAAEVLASLPRSAQTQDTESKLATCYQQIGEAYAGLNELGAAAEAYRRMLSVARRLLLRNPNVGRFRIGVAKAQFNLAQLAYAASNSDGGDARFVECQDTLFEGVAVSTAGDALAALVDFTAVLSELLAEHPDLRGRAVGFLDRARRQLESLDADGAESDRISRAIARLQQAADRLRTRYAGEPGA